MVPSVEESGNRFLKVFDAEKDAAFNGFVVQVAEPALHEIHPAGTRGNEVRDEARMPLEPGTHFLVFVSAVVVHDQMQRHIARELLVEPTKELQELLVPVSLMAFAHDLAL